MYKVITLKARYQSGGTINVASTTLLSSLSDVQGNPNFGYDTPAGATSKQLGSLLQTDQFVTSVASAAGLQQALASGQVTLDDVRASIASWAAGSNLLKVVATDDNPATAQNIATATINEFTQMIVDSQVSDSTAARSFYEDLAKAYQADVDRATAALEAFLRTSPAPPVGVARPDDQQAACAPQQRSLAGTGAVQQRA